MPNPPTSQSLLAKADIQAWADLHDRYLDVLKAAPEGDQVMHRLEQNYSKYFDLAKWVQYHHRHAVQMGLHEAKKPLRILDIGCGPGIFMFVAKTMGHEPAGFDVGSKMYAEMAQTLKVEYHSAMVIPNEALPSQFQNLDWVTAIATKFDQPDFADPSAIVWTIKEWRFFFADLASRLRTGGKIYIKPNVGYDGKLFETKDVADYFAKISSWSGKSNEFIIPKENMLTQD